MRENLQKPEPQDYLISCTVDIEREMRERPWSWHEPPPMHTVMEPTGIIRGHFHARIANCSLDPFAVMSNDPVVFEWPEGRCFLKVIITDISIKNEVGQRRLFDVRGEVLGIARYGATRLTEQEAHQRLGMPQKQLTQGI